jgi:uncharacterized protein YdhG (YjbR/CyaY superfamily)
MKSDEIKKSSDSKINDLDVKKSSVNLSDQKDEKVINQNQEKSKPKVDMLKLSSKILIISIIVFVICLFLMVILSMGVFKPVIYLYPESETNVSVKLDFRGDLTVTYPEYNDGWNVIAYPDGKLINLDDNKEYSYLFWEGVDNKARYDMSLGFVVKGEDTAKFLQEKLEEIGLIPKEYNEFIVYWLPKMKDNKYNLIHFATKQEYDERAILDINPKPDSVLRVFMVFKKLIHNNVKVTPQYFQGFERVGFSVVEWGGTQIR